MKELLCYPACHHGDEEEGGRQFPQAVAAILVFEEMLEAIFIICLFHDFVFLPLIPRITQIISQITQIKELQ